VRDVGLLLLSIDILLGPDTYLALGNHIPALSASEALPDLPGALGIAILAGAIGCLLLPVSMQIISLRKERA
jgi:hypothetical protein